MARSPGTPSPVRDGAGGDPLAQIIALLRPSALFAKGITGAGRWAVHYEALGRPGFCAVIEGRCRLEVSGEAPVILEAGDFVLLPATPAFTLGSLALTRPRRVSPPPPADAATAAHEEVRHGRVAGPAEVRLRGGHFRFDSPDAALLVSLLPPMLHLRGDPRLATLVRLFGEESQQQRPGRALVLVRLVELLLIEALRAAPGRTAPPGLLRGLADARIAGALRAMHGAVARPWTVEALAQDAGLSRSAFFARFDRCVGQPPMQYLLAWRMALAKDLLRGPPLPLDEVARRVGYGSASTFSTAFSRHTGQAPGRFARQSAD